MTRTLDFAPLVEPIERSALREWIAARKGTSKYAEGSLAARIFLGILLAMIAVPIAAFLVVMTIGFATELNPEAFTPTGIAGLGVGMLVVLALLYGVIRGIRSWARGFGQWRRWYRLFRFAEANDLSFSTRTERHGYPGTVFEGGTSSVLVDHLRPRGEVSPDYGTAWRITEMSGRASSEEFAYVALKLNRTLPHLMLDSKRGRGRTAIAGREQVLSLEGDFDKHFTLYAPVGYEGDALYVFTPDLMALLIDEANTFEVEIVDDWMMLHSTTLFDLMDPAVHDRVFRIADMVGAKARRQTDRYRDDRVAELSKVARRGRRLRRALSASGIAIAVVVVLLPFLPLIVSTATAP